MANQDNMIELKTNTSELFDLFHFVQKMDLDASFERINYPQKCLNDSY